MNAFSTTKTIKRIVFVFLPTVLVFFYLIGCSPLLNRDVDIEQFSVAESRQTLAGSARPEIVVAAYNIAHGRGSELGASNWDADDTDRAARQIRLTKIGELLAELNVDIVVLNEVDFDANWSSRVDQAEEIARAGGFEYVARQPNYYLRMPWFSLNFGNAVLSKYPIVQADRVALPPMKKLEALTYGNHDALLAKVEVGEQIVDVWALHLEVRSEETRVDAVREILSQIDFENPTMILGDLNSQPSGSEETTALDELVKFSGFGVYPSYQNPTWTFPAENPNRTLDWVLFSPGIELIEGQVVPSDYSDHLPVIVRFEILE